MWAFNMRMSTPSGTKAWLYNVQTYSFLENITSNRSSTNDITHLGVGRRPLASWRHMSQDMSCEKNPRTFIHKSKAVTLWRHRDIWIVELACFNSIHSSLVTCVYLSGFYHLHCLRRGEETQTQKYIYITYQKFRSLSF